MSDSHREIRFADNVKARHRTGKIWRMIFLAATAFSIVMLAILLLNIINGLAGYVAIASKVDPASLAINGVPIEEQSNDQLVALLRSNLSSGAYNKLENERPFAERSHNNLYQLVIERIVRPDVLDSWNLWVSITNGRGIRESVQSNHPEAHLRFIFWLNSSFVSRPQSSDPLTAGIRTAILGSLWTIVLTILTAFPLGVGAAVYLEEYAGDNRLNRLIQTNINNLAGVPSIVYGILGLAIFVRSLEPLTSGTLFGYADSSTANGRTVLSAGMTLGLLVLPIVIINAQEAIRAVPQSLRGASYGLGATKWQTVWSHVLPNAMSGILTGTILAVSRAFGETAPLVVVGASTAISFDPTSPFSKFTTLPIQIYQWTARPQDEFRALAAAAILLLLILLLLLNSAAILLRNRYSQRL
jgi:phosphate transport system permease protein